jgi:xylulokinase
MFAAGFPCYRFAEPAAYFTFSLNHAAGLLLQWFADEFRETDEDGNRSYAITERVTSPSPLLILPYFNGRGTPVNDVGAKGLIAGLTLSTGRADIAGAILDALAYDMKVNLEAMEAASLPINRLRCVGGGARSPAGLQSKAEVCGIPVETLEITEAACFGAALLAGIGVGAYKNVAETAGLVKTRVEYAPRLQTAAAYLEKYSQFQRLYQINEAILRDI